MKNRITMGLFALIITFNCTAQSSEEAAIQETIIAFAKAGDNNDVDKLDTYLDENYRVVMNRLFGSTEVAVMPKSVYLEKIRNKEFGGDNRQVEIQSITQNGTTANAKVSLVGTQMTFVSLLTLIKDEEGQWKLISDVPVIN